MSRFFVMLIVAFVIVMLIVAFVIVMLSVVVFIVMLSVTFFTVFAESRYSECRSAVPRIYYCYAECRCT